MSSAFFGHAWIESAREFAESSSKAQLQEWIQEDCIWQPWQICEKGLHEMIENQL